MVPNELQALYQRWNSREDHIHKSTQRVVVLSIYD